MKEKNKNPISTLPKNSSQETEYNDLIQAVKVYENRIKDIEESTYWKLYLFFTKTKLILTSDSYLKSDQFKFFQRIRFLFSKSGFILIFKFLKQLFNLLFGKVNHIVGLGKGYEKVNYEQYKAKHFPRENDLDEMTENIKNFDYQPYIQIYVIVNDENFKHLNVFLNTLDSQIYPYFFVTFINKSKQSKIKFTIEKICKNDYKYSFINLDENNCSNLDIESEYALFVKMNCLLRADLIYQFVNEINSSNHLDFIYSDNDFLISNESNHSYYPYFKPDWSPHTILSRNYIGNLFLVSKNILQTTNFDLRLSFYHLVLNFSNQSQNIKHISKVLFHEFEEEIESFKIQEDHKSLNLFLNQQYGDSYAKISEASLGCFEPVFETPKALVSIIIPAKNKASILDTCLKSLFEKSTYQNFEVLIIDNGSNEKSFLGVVSDWEFNYPEKVFCHRIDIPFNYSILNNRAAEFAKGEYLLFLNNDTELISPNLIEELLKIAQLKNAGAVGPKLLYPNNTIQHAGIVLSLEETGAHIYSGAHKDTSGYFNNTNCLTNYSAVTGACMMLEKSKFDLVGGFDENLAVDCNDVELCCRLYQAGFHNIYLPWVKMYHYECLTRGNPMISNQSLAKQSIEKQYFIKKWGKLIQNDPYYNKNLTRISKKYELKHV